MDVATVDDARKAILKDIFWQMNEISFGFNADQRAQLAELLAEENNSLWAAVLYGIGVSDDTIVAVALSQVDNIGGLFINYIKIAISCKFYCVLEEKMI